MTCNAVIISQPNINFDQFLASANTVLGRNPASAVDKLAGRTTFEKFTSCLGAIFDPDFPAGLHDEFLNHLTCSAFIVCPIYDLVFILSVASGMPFVIGETKDGNHAAIVLTGTLHQWHIAVRNGTDLRQPHGCRECYCRLMERFESLGLGKLWADRAKQWDATGNLYYLKHDRN